MPHPTSPTVARQDLQALQAVLPPGAHLSSPRLGYAHHGIYAGGGRVIHYAGLGRGCRRGPVEETSLEAFADGRGACAIAEVAPRFDGATVVTRARSRLGEDRYRFWTNNCEHFCEWCVSGRSRSPQVEVWREPARRAASLVSFWWRAAHPASWAIR